MTESSTFLVTGAAGFIGAAITRKLLNQGHTVFAVDDLSSGLRANIDPNASFLQIDLTESKALSNLPPHVDYIFHLAGQSSGEISFDDPPYDLSLNTIATLNLINYAIKSNAKRLVYASSMSVYGQQPDHPVSESSPVRPLSCYGVSKLASEHYLRIFQDKLPYTIFRLFNVYGPGQNLANLRQGMVSIYLAQALSTSPNIIVKGSLCRFRDFIHIDDVVTAWTQCILTNLTVNQTINLATGVRTTVSDLLNHLLTYFPDKKLVVQASTPGDQSGIYADITKLKHLLPSSIPRLTLVNGLKTLF